MFFLNRNERGWRVAFPDWQLPERNVRETNVYPHSLRALARPSTPIICVISPWNFLGGTRCTKALQSLRRQDPEADVTRNEITSLMSAATAFEPGTSIKDNAENHCGRPVVIALDVKDFFPSLKYSRVLALFRRYTETENAAVMLAKLCTLYGHLPQGAVTSPHISNLLLHDLDFTLKLYALDHNLEFTRYADDLTFSGNPDNGKSPG